MNFKEFLHEGDLQNAKLSYSVKGSAQSSGELSWSMAKHNIILADISKRKTITVYRTYSLSERDWETLFNGGYTEIGNINVERGLTSLTTDKKMVNRFRGGGDITIVIELKMSKYSEILNNSIYPEEREILGNNVKWKVTDIDDNSNNWYIIGKQI